MAEIELGATPYESTLSSLDVLAVLGFLNQYAKPNAMLFSAGLIFPAEPRLRLPCWSSSRQIIVASRSSEHLRKLVQSIALLILIIRCWPKMLQIWQSLSETLPQLQSATSFKARSLRTIDMCGDTVRSFQKPQLS